MKLNQPTKVVWFISLFLGFIGSLLFLADIFTPWNFLMLVVAWALLVLGSILKKF